MDKKPTYDQLVEEIKSLKQKLADQQKHDSLSNFFEHNKSIMLKMNVKTKRIVDANCEAVKFYGYTKEELKNKKISELNTLPEEKIAEIIKKAIKKASNFFEFKYRIATGEIKDIRIYQNTLNDPNEELVLLTIYDVTAQKKFEKNLKDVNEELRLSEEEVRAASEELSATFDALKELNEELEIAKQKAEENEFRLKEAQQIAHLGHWEYDLINDKLIWSDETYRIFGLKPQKFEATLNNFLQMTHPEDRQEVADAYNQSVKNKTDYKISHRIVLKDGTVKHVLEQGKTFYTHADKPIRSIGTVLDITEIKKHEIVLKEQKEKYAILAAEYKIAIGELIKIKDKAQENEEKFRAITTQATEGITVADLKGNYTFVNPAFCKMSGYTEEELLKMTVFDMKSPNQPPTSFYESKLTKEGQAIRVLLKKKTGEEYITEIVGKKIKIAGKQLVLGTIRDISDRVKAEQALIKAKKRAEDSEKRFKALHSASFGGIAIHDKGIILDCNLGLSEMFGYSIDELSGMDGLKLVAPSQRDFVMSQILSGYEKPYETIGFKKDGKEFPVRIEARNIPYKGKRVRVTEFRDITKDKKAEKELIKEKERAEESEKRFKTLSQATNEAIFISKKGICIDTNDAATKMFGYTYDEIIGIFGTDVIAPESKELVKENMLKGYEKPYRATAIRKDGTKFTAEFQGQMYESHGEKIRITAVRDITNTVKFEKALIRAKERAEESDRLKTEFINNMSHEIRTPMNGIMGFTDLLKKNGLSHDKKEQYINIVQNCGTQLLKIVDDILEIARLETKQVKTQNEKLNLNDFLLAQFSIFDLKAKEKEIPLYLNKGLKDDESLIYTDKYKLNKIISNLLENALKFTDSGHIELGYKLVNENIQIYVEDTGIGIPNDKLSVIFERFSQAESGFSRKFGGLGLGLSIAKENSELLGGSITVESEVGVGTKFTVTIPFKPLNKINNKDNSKKQAVLVVEDEEINYLYLETLLHEIDENFEITHAKNGKEAVEFAPKIKPVVILMDIKMPIMNGYEATQKIKELCPNAIIIAQTAYTTDNDKQKALDAGCSDFITKPINAENLETVLQKYM